PAGTRSGSPGRRWHAGCWRPLASTRASAIPQEPAPRGRSPGERRIVEPTLAQIERSDRAWAPTAAMGLPLARALTYGLWALVVCAYGYLVVHVAGQEGIDFGHMYWGPKAVLDGVSPYPTSSDPNSYAELGKAYFIFPPGSPLLLTP